MHENLKKHRQEILEVTRRYGIFDVKVFGSFARNEDDHESDIDLLVEFKPGFTLLSHAALVRELETILGKKVDVVSKNGLRDRIKEKVIKEAVPL